MESIPVATQDSTVRTLMRAVASTRSPQSLSDLGLVVLRAVVACIFIYHGSRRLFGWFDGPGLDASADYFADVAGLSPGKLFAILGGTIEFGGGIAIALGLGSRLAGAAIFGDMMMAIITVTHSAGFNSTGNPNTGWELNLALGVLALMLTFFGSGRFSIDAQLEQHLAAAPTS